MAKLTLPDIGTLANSTSARQAINDNFTAIEAALDNTLSRDGTTPNQMEADIDLNGNDLLNVQRVDASEFYKDGLPFEQSVAYGNKFYETFSGTGAQQDYTLAVDPGSLGNLAVSVDGVVQRPGIDFNYSGTTLNFTIPPSLGTNNILVRYDEALPLGAVDIAGITYVPQNTGVAGTLKAYLDSFWSATGGAAIRFIQNGTGAIFRNILLKLGESISVEDFGAVGDGVTNDETAILNALNQGVAAGRTVTFDGSKTYAIGLQLAIPANAKLQTNGAVFYDLNGTGGNSPLITMSSGVLWDKLRVRIPTGRTRERVVVITGDDYYGTMLEILSDDQQANTTDNSDAALRIVGADRGHIGYVRVDKFDRAVQVNDTEDTTFNKLKITNYVTGLWSIDNRNMKVSWGRITTKSPNGSYTAGHVGILSSCDLVGGSRNNTYSDITIEDAGEHGVRVGGPLSQENIHFPRLRTKNCGGSGLKILGTDSGAPTDRNRNITFHNAIIEDCGSGGLTSNMCGILAMYCDGVYGDNVVIRKNAKLQSGHTGVRIVACSDVRITGDIADATFDGVWVDGALGDLNRVHVGGISRANGRDGYRLTAGTSTIRRPTTDLVCDGNAGIGMNIAVGGGSLTDGLFRAKLHANTGGAAACDHVAATLDFQGAAGATPISGVTAANASTWRDGLLYTRDGGKWIGRGRVTLGSIVTNNNAVANTMQDVTGLSFPVTAGRTYRWKFVIPYSAAATTTGSRWSVTGPATTFLAYRSEYSLTTTSRTVNDGLGGAYDAPAASNTDSPSTSARNIAIVEGTLIPSASGTLQARFASEVASSAITASANAYVEYEEVL